MWYQKFLNTYRAGISHEFILYFNIRDVVDNYRSLERYIYDEFIKQRIWYGAFMIYQRVLLL